MKNIFNDDVIPYRDKLINFLSSFINVNNLQYKSTAELENITNNVIEYNSQDNNIKLNYFEPNTIQTKPKRTIFKNNNKYLDKFEVKNQSLGFGGLKLNNSNPEFDIIDKHYPQTVERNIEDILYPTMPDFNPKKKIGLLNNELMIENYREENLKNSVSWITPLNSWTLKSKYGMRFHPIYKRMIKHDGIDMGVPVGTPVYAVDNGIVVYSGWYNGYGKYIEIDHGNDLHSFYGHLNRIDVSVGDRVCQGDIIGLSGSTGYSTGPHLHFGVHKNREPINPFDCLP